MRGYILAGAILAAVFARSVGAQAQTIAKAPEHPACVYPDPYSLLPPHSEVEKVDYLPLDFAGIPIRWMFVSYSASYDSGAKVFVLSCDGTVLAQTDTGPILTVAFTTSITNREYVNRDYTVEAHYEDLRNSGESTIIMQYKNNEILHLWVHPIRTETYWPGTHPGVAHRDDHIRKVTDTYSWTYNRYTNTIEVTGQRATELKSGSTTYRTLSPEKFCYRPEFTRYVPCN